ncbi:hypothetical protein QAD02_018390 [Eretmocerus hayati]|uniref:Uncharacterized protein n=1 Tax=Eretmocerus hayati TaxID=131215 RepID=A0ACC2PGJ9_9HYME|nr:hypothetical protein QAD02_018390 [Eretmocerus hayati]
MTVLKTIPAKNGESLSFIHRYIINLEERQRRIRSIMAFITQLEWNSVIQSLRYHTFPTNLTSITILVVYRPRLSAMASPKYTCCNMKSAADEFCIMRQRHASIREALALQVQHQVPGLLDCTGIINVNTSEMSGLADVRLALNMDESMHVVEVD